MGWKIMESNPYNDQKLFPSFILLITRGAYSAFNCTGAMNYFLGRKAAGASSK
jgi:hypothetical protein